ncbi:MAG: hypothetical protein QMD01_08805 [Thermodesulfovibrionales bacterium]|nr:hypothetical protein [Thermodesulfovibrionales bacterium]
MPHLKIAIIHPQLKVGGGSEANPLWIIETLKKDYDVYMITMGGVDLKELNKCYGTNLKPDEINIISLPIPYLFKNRFDALRGYRLARFCKRHSSDYDLMISTYNVMDFGRKGIQFIADFSFDDNIRRSFDFSPKGVKGLFYKQSPIRWLYLTIAKLIAGGSVEGWKKNLTIANSHWSGQVMKEAHGIDCQTIYPPVAGDFPNISWDERENGFVVMARLVPEKRVDRIIKILGGVRRRGYDIHLHILSRTDDSEYAMSLKQLCEENKDWVFMEGLVTGDKKLEFIARHKFSISG